MLKAPPRLKLVEWAETYRRIAAKTSASPGIWKTSAQPIAFGIMEATTDADTHTISVMAATQVVKTEYLINVAGYYIHQDPSPILFVQPSQGAASAFSKERFSPTVAASPALRDLVRPPRARDSENTITHKSYPGGSIDFVGANSPTDLASRPKRIILSDEIDKYPPSAGSEGDPLKLAEERGSTYKALGRAKFVRACSPTVEGISRIAREYGESDRRKCFVECPHCEFEQVLTWAHVRWSKDGHGNALAETAALVCENCGTVWSERERVAVLDALEHAPGFGWRQTKEFVCCDEQQSPAQWDHAGRARCYRCGQRAPFAGHAGFHVSKLYSKCHRLPELVTEFVKAQGDPELLRTFTNTALAELWKLQPGESVANEDLIGRAERYGPDDLPDEVLVATAFTDVQGDRLEVQVVGWGHDEESWPFLYEIIHSDPAQPAAWAELDILRQRIFTTKSGRKFRISALGVDAGYHTAMVLDYCRKRRGQRVFACMGRSGSRPLWPTRATRSKSNDPIYLTGVDAGKEAIYGRLKIQPPAPGHRKPGFIHFPIDDAFGPEYFAQLTSEVRLTAKRMGQFYTKWALPTGKRNEALDTFVGALAVRRSLPRRIEAELEIKSVVSSKPPEPLAEGASKTGLPPRKSRAHLIPR